MNNFDFDLLKEKELIVVEQYGSLPSNPFKKFLCFFSKKYKEKYVTVIKDEQVVVHGNYVLMNHNTVLKLINMIENSVSEEKWEAFMS